MSPTPMTTFYLVRHAPTDWIDRGLAGRTDVPLSAAGKHRADRLANRLSGERLDALQASPLLRVQETAAAVARVTGLRVETVPALTEVDFGTWTGRDFAALETLPGWRRWNAFRSGSWAPEGESMIDVQARFTGHMMRLAEEHPGGRFALFSHADPIRAALAYWLGMPIDFFLRIEIAPASVSIVEIGEWGPRVLTTNEVPPE